jgi:hypothetical protein
MTTILTIGDTPDFDSFQKFYRNRRCFPAQGFRFKSVDYTSLLAGRLPAVATRQLVAFLFFPFDYWDTYIEAKKDPAVYGNRTYYLKFKKFWTRVERILVKAYPDKTIRFVNHPSDLSLDRDKEKTKRVLARARVPVPRSYTTRDARKVLSLLEKGKRLYIKVRFGSMGKGITYLEKGRWLTNFRFRAGTIKSRKSDYGWTFRQATGNLPFLKQLLKQDIIVEEAIDPLVVRGRMLDLRLYVCFGKVLYIYPRSTAAGQVTTNISQGARGEPQRYLKNIPDRVLKEASRQAVKAARAMRLRFTGIDIMPEADGKKVKVIEANTFPGFPKSRSYNLSKRIIACITAQSWK